MDIDFTTIEEYLDDNEVYYDTYNNHMEIYPDSCVRIVIEPLTENTIMCSVESEHMENCQFGTKIEFEVNEDGNMDIILTKNFSISVITIKPNGD